MATKKKATTRISIKEAHRRKTVAEMNVVEERVARVMRLKKPGPEVDGQLIKEMFALDPAAHTVFATGAFRDSDKDKIDFEGHLSPLALDLLGRYMHKHRFLKDGSVRASDNWQLGFDDASFVKSGMRHWMAVWRIMRGWPAEESLEDALGGLLFNANGLAHQFEKRRIEAEQKAA